MEIQQNMYPLMKKVPQAPIKEVEALLLGSKVLPDGSSVCDQRYSGGWMP